MKGVIEVRNSQELRVVCPACSISVAQRTMNANVTHTCEDQDKRKQSDFLPEAYMLANNRMHEIDAEKAMALVLTRHEKWKAGGPL